MPFFLVAQARFVPDPGLDRLPEVYGGQGSMAFEFREVLVPKPHDDFGVGRRAGTVGGRYSPRSSQLYWMD